MPKRFLSDDQKPQAFLNLLQGRESHDSIFYPYGIRRGVDFIRKYIGRQPGYKRTTRLLKDKNLLCSR